MRLGRLLRNLAIASFIFVCIAVITHSNVNGEAVADMKFDQMIVPLPGGGTEICWHCAHMGNECHDPYNEAICQGY